MEELINQILCNENIWTSNVYIDYVSATYNGDILVICLGFLFVLLGACGLVVTHFLESKGFYDDLLWLFIMIFSGICIGAGIVSIIAGYMDFYSIIQAPQARFIHYIVGK